MSNSSPSGSTPSSGRRRGDRQYAAEDDALSKITKEAEQRLAAKRAARAEARKIRMKEVERQQAEAESNEVRYRDAADGSLRTYSSRAGSDSSVRSGRRGSDGSESEVKELKKDLSDLEEKFKKSMITNAQLDNEKSTLMYQLDLLKDDLELKDETMCQLQREIKDVSRGYDFAKRDLDSSNKQVTNLKEQVQHLITLIQEHGLVLVGAGDSMKLEADTGLVKEGEEQPLAILSQQTAKILDEAGEGSLEERLRKFAEEKKDLEDRVRRLRITLEEEREANSQALKEAHKVSMALNGLDDDRNPRDSGEARIKLMKAEQEVASLRSSLNRNERDLKRAQQQVQELEQEIDDLKTDKRKTQRELREARSRIEEVETEKGHLQKRLDKLRKERINAMTNG